MMERAALSALGIILMTMVGATVVKGFLSGEWAQFRATMFVLGVALVLFAAYVVWVEVTARRDARLQAELTEKFAQTFAERIPHTVPAVINLARELGHTDARTLDDSPVLELHGDGQVTLRGGRATSAWAGTYDLRTVRKVRNHFHHDPTIIGGVAMGDIETAIVFYRAVERAAEPLFALDVMWLALPEVRDYLRSHVPWGIRNDFTSEWWPRRRPAYFSISDERQQQRWRHTLVSTYGWIKWDDDDRERVTITAPSREAFVPDPERLAETRRQERDAAKWVTS